MLPTSPRRRAALAGLVAVLVALAVAIAVVVTGGGASGGDGGRVAQDAPGPVLLVPGYGGDTTAVGRLAEVLRAGGREATVVPAPGDGTGDLREQARGLDRVAREALASGAPSVDVVGYSAGGVVARIWVAELGGDAYARRVVTLGSPHHGTESALAVAELLPGACPEACRQLVPDGPLLADLPESPPGPLWTSVWTEDDQVVTPPDSAVMAGAVNVDLQAVCADARVDHGQLPTDPLVVGVVRLALSVEPLRSAPGPQECAALRSGTG